jgi:hypothetical protein
MYSVLIPTKGRDSLIKAVKSVDNPLVDNIILTANIVNDNIREVIEYTNAHSLNCTLVCSSKFTLGDLYVEGSQYLSGYCFILEDDDYLLSKTILKKVSNHLTPTSCVTWKCVSKLDLDTQFLCSLIMEKLKITEYAPDILKKEFFNIFGNTFMFSSTIYPAEILQSSLKGTVNDYNFLNTHNDELVFLNALKDLDNVTVTNQIGIAMGDNKDHYSSGKDRLPFIVYSAVDTYDSILCHEYDWALDWFDSVLKNLSDSIEETKYINKIVNRFRENHKDIQKEIVEIKNTQKYSGNNIRENVEIFLRSIIHDISKADSKNS